MDQKLIFAQSLLCSRKVLPIHGIVGVASFSDLVELLLFQTLPYNFTILDLTELFKLASL